MTKIDKNKQQIDGLYSIFEQILNAMQEKGHGAPWPCRTVVDKSEET